MTVGVMRCCELFADWGFNFSFDLGTAATWNGVSIYCILEQLSLFIAVVSEVYRI